MTYDDYPRFNTKFTDLSMATEALIGINGLFTPQRFHSLTYPHQCREEGHASNGCRTNYVSLQEFVYSGYDLFNRTKFVPDNWGYVLERAPSVPLYDSSGIVFGLLVQKNQTVVFQYLNNPNGHRAPLSEQLETLLK